MLPCHLDRIVGRSLGVEGPIVEHTQQALGIDISRSSRQNQPVGIGRVTGQPGGIVRRVNGEFVKRLGVTGPRFSVQSRVFVNKGLKMLDGIHIAGQAVPSQRRLEVRRFSSPILFELAHAPLSAFVPTFSRGL